VVGCVRLPIPVRLVAIGGLALAVGGGLYVLGSRHTPDYAVSLFGLRADGANMLKAELGTVMLGFAVYQLILALWIYGRLPGVRPARPIIHSAHRAGGILLFLVSLPIAYHCMSAYGAQLTSGRVGLHSLAGCFFFGAFVAKVIVVRSQQLPRWALPLAGGALIMLVAILWYTGALYQLNRFSTPGLS
jgi:Family of unknown function (DUF6529)